MTRKEYLSLLFPLSNIKDISTLDVFHRYYGQYVDETVIFLVVKMLGKARIKASKENHFNDIRFEVWEKMVDCLSPEIKAALEKNGDELTTVVGMRILKEAALQIKQSI